MSDKFNSETMESLALGSRQMPGHFQTEVCNLIKNDGGTVDLMPVMSSITVEESIDSAFMVGTITCQDPFNQLLKYDIQGNERIELIVSDEVMQVKKYFRIYKIADLKRVNNQTWSYSYKFMSNAWFKSILDPISKSYQDKKAEEIIKDMFEYKELYSDEFYGFEEVFKYQNSRYKQSCIIPNWDVARACNFLASRTLADDEFYHNNTYAFFETFDSAINLFAKDALLDESINTTYGKFMYDPARTKNDVRYDPSNIKRLASFEDLDLDFSMDHLANVKNGMYMNRNTIIDLTERKQEDKDYNYIEEYPNELHLEVPLAPSSTSLIRSDDFMTKNPLACWHPIITSKGLYTKEDDHWEWNAKTRHKRLSRDNQMRQYKLIGKLPGHLGLKAGMKINLELSEAAITEFKSGTGFDYKFSGKYLINTVIRDFTLDKFDITVVMTKDSQGARQ